MWQWIHDFVFHNLFGNSYIDSQLFDSSSKSFPFPDIKCLNACIVFEGKKQNIFQDATDCIASTPMSHSIQTYK